jgi:hypothetical protein
MAADRQRLAAALAYRQAEEERRRRMMESVPVPGAEIPAAPPSRNFRRDLENLSIGIGEGLTRQLEGVREIVTDPIGAAKGAYEGVKAVVRDPGVIADALRYTGQKAMSGPLGAGEVIGEMVGPMRGKPPMAELDVYHGTPHRFPATEANPLGEFDASKIGTGEGAQAYGHGIYLAESPNVAKSYIKTPQDWAAQANVKGSTYRNAHAQISKIERELRQKYKENIPKNEISAFMYAEQNPEKFDSKMIEKITLARQAEEKAYKDFSSGAFYKADLPDEMIDRMLDWDKPLREQPTAVRKAIKNRLRHSNSSQKFLETDPTGEDLYYVFQNRGDHINPIEASEAFRRAGIPGIKYADAGSRGQGGSGTRNFVVFPGEEKKVRILERNGQKAPPQKIAQALEATAKDQNLVDVFNKIAKREIESVNKRIIDPDEPYLTLEPISNLKELDQLSDPVFNYAKASVLKHIGEKNGFKVKLEGSNVSPSVYAKFTKVDDEGLTDFKVRISDHADVSRNKPSGEKKAYDINPESNGSMEEIVRLLNDPEWLKQFYELD